MEARYTVVGIGEALFDILGTEARLGGAPLNAAVHTHQLGADLGVRGVVVSRVGQDDLGTRLVQELADRGMDTASIQTDWDRPTGKAYVDLDADGQPVYDIVDGAAWDWLQFDPDLETLAEQSAAVCFGTLGQRCAESRTAIQRFLGEARRAYKLLDVNLREDFDEPRLLAASLDLADALKLSKGELEHVCQLTNTRGDDPDAQCAALLKAHDLQLVALTRGAEGVRLYTPSDTIDGTPATLDPTDDADPVGAGDAVSAVLILGKLMRWPLQRIADTANRVGAHVASQPGATPELPADLLNE